MLGAAERREIFRNALRARRFEARIQTLARAGEIGATLHPGAGHELCQLAALAALRPDDPMLYGHRGTAYFLARGLPLAAILCDLAYREGGTNRGKGGLMHVVDPARGILGESGTLGGNFVIGAGVALAERLQGRDSVTVVFFGDGSSNRGQFHEAANFAALKRLPILFFCENNGWALSVAARDACALPEIARRAAGYGMPGVTVDGGDIDAVHAATREAAERARSGAGPSLVEATVERLQGHYLGDSQPYRDAAERSAVAARDPLPRLQAQLLESGALDEPGLSALERAIDAEIEAAVAAMREQPLVPPASALERVYAT